MSDRKSQDPASQDHPTVLQEKLKSILDTPHEKRGPAARAVLEVLRVYNKQIESPA